MKRLLVLAGALLVAAPAGATPDFPPLIVSTLNITCADGGNPIWDNNGCTICHTTNGGGIGTATHPFGAALKQMGLTAYNEAELMTLLENEKSAMDDFNCDGIPDIQELEDCEWPALAMTGMCAASDGGTDAGISAAIEYGCATSGASSPALPGSLAAGVAGLLGIALVRARKRSRASERPRR